jgi:hypothetical protein
MGCAGSRVKLEGIDQPLYFPFESFKIETIDNYFVDQVDTLMKIEAFRETYVDCYEKLASLSGACVWKGHDFSRIYLSYLVNCELEATGFYKNLVSISFPPYFKHEVKLIKHAKLNDCLITFIKLTIGGELQEVIREDDEALKDKRNQFEKLLEEQYKDENQLYITIINFLGKLKAKS